MYADHDNIFPTHLDKLSHRYMEMELEFSTLLSTLHNSLAQLRNEWFIYFRSVLTDWRILIPLRIDLINSFQ